jgi:hypothetical protein
MLQKFFYSRKREYRGGFLRPMFEFCSKIEKTCGFCTIDTYNPMLGKKDSEEREFCGLASSFDTRVSSIPNCWISMSKSQRSLYIKKKKEEYQILRTRIK